MHMEPRTLCGNAEKTGILVTLLVHWLTCARTLCVVCPDTCFEKYAYNQNDQHTPDGGIPTRIMPSWSGSQMTASMTSETGANITVAD